MATIQQPAVKCTIDTPAGPCGALVFRLESSETGATYVCTGGHGWVRRPAWGSEPAVTFRADHIAREAFCGDIDER